MNTKTTLAAANNSENLEKNNALPCQIKKQVKQYGALL